MFPESLLQSLVKHKVDHCFSDTSIGGSNPTVKATQTFSVVDTHGTLKATGAPLVSAPKGRKERFCFVLSMSLAMLFQY